MVTRWEQKGKILQINVMLGGQSRDLATLAQDSSSN